MLRKVRNILLSVMALLLILILIVMASLTAIITTQTGSQWAVKLLAERTGVAIGDLQGNLYKGLDINSIGYHLNDQEYRAQNVSFRWRPLALAQKKVSIQSLKATHVYIKLSAAAKEKQSSTFNKWPNIHLPVTIDLDLIRLDNIIIQQAGRSLSWKRLTGSLQTDAAKLIYNDLQLLHQNYFLILNGVSESNFPYTTKADLQWQYLPQGTSDLLVDGQLSEYWFAGIPDRYRPRPIPSSLINSPGQTKRVSPTVPIPFRSSVTKTPLDYAGHTEINGDLNTLKLMNKISRPIVLTAAAKIILVEPDRELKKFPLAELHLSWTNQVLPADWWLPKQSLPITSGQLHAQGSLQNYHLSLDGDINVPSAPTLAVRAKAEGSLHKIDIDYLEINEVLSGLNSVPGNNAGQAVKVRPAKTNQTLSGLTTNQGLRIQGVVSWSPELLWRLKMETQQLNLGNLFTEFPSEINSVFFTSGKINASSWQGKIEQLALSGNLRGLNLEGGGNIEFDGANWRSEALDLILGANSVHLNGSLGAQLSLDWDIRAPILNQLTEDLHGSLISKGALRGSGKLPQFNSQTKIENFSWGDYKVGNLELILEPKVLISVAPLITQHTNGFPSPSSFTLNNKLSTLLANSEFLREQYRLIFLAKKLRVGKNKFSQISLNGTGSINRHELHFLVKSSAYGNTEFALSGNYGDEVWQGEFTQLSTKLKKVPRWWLTSSQPIRIGAKNFELGNLCLTTTTNLTAVIERSASPSSVMPANAWLKNQSPSLAQYDWLLNKSAPAASVVEKMQMPQLCVRSKWSPQQGAEFQAKLDSIPLRQFYSLFKTEVFFAGVMDGFISFTASSFNLPDLEAKANITTRNAELRYQFVGAITEVYPWRDFGLTATLTKGMLNATAGMDWVGYGRVDASTTLNLPAQKINSGKLAAQFTNLAPLETILTFANDVTGDLKAAMNFSGDFSRPNILGDIRVRNGTTNLPRLGVNLKNIELLINSSEAGRVNLISRMQSGKGQLAVVGELNQLGTPAWNLTGDINGTDFEVINLKQLKANLSPDINVIADRESIRIAGDALIPWARANIKSLPKSATQVSSDVVIVDEDSATAVNEVARIFYSNVNLALGSDVRFKGFGLDSKLSGKVNILKESKRQLLTSGFVSVDEGSYKAYSQTLDVERGRLIFQGPYENPGLDIRASRKIITTEETITVGLEVSGTLQRPKAKVYSIPSDSDSNAMMMLLTGKPAGEASKADASMLVSAISGLGGNDSGDMITADIAQFFRIDEFEIKSDKGIDQSQLWIGKNLTPKLLVRYVVGIFDQAFSLGMRYQLSEKLRLEAESGETQSVDIIYKIER